MQIGDKFYYVVDCEDGIFMSGITVNENNIYCDFSQLDTTPLEAIKRYKLELYKEFDNKLFQLNQMGANLTSL